LESDIPQLSAVLRSYFATVSEWCKKYLITKSIDSEVVAVSSIMMDRWSLSNVYKHLGVECYDGIMLYELDDIGAFSYRDHTESRQKCWDNFLMSVILWDEIWSFHRVSNFHFEYNTDNAAIKNLFVEIIHHVESDVLSRDMLDIYDLLNQGRSPNKQSMIERTLGYQLISNFLGVSFLAHPLRNRVSSKNMIEMFTRFDIIKQIDKELLSYYEEINKSIGRNILCFNYPVLIDMIRKETNTPEDELLSAMELRSENDVSLFRSQMYDVEQKINCGNTQEILSELKLVSDIAKEITEKYKKKTSLGEISISLSPSISKSIIFENNRKKALHATFIRRLIKHGVYNRHH